MPGAHPLDEPRPQDLRAVYAGDRAPSTGGKEGTLTSSSRPPTFIRPPRLQPGATLAAVSPSSGLANRFPHRYEAGKHQLEAAFGVRVVEAPNALRSDAFLRSNPQARADDLHWALAHPDVSGLICTIGGDDAVRILPYLDPDVIRAHPKVVLGFSDATVVLTAFLRAGVLAFHGPSLMTDLAENGGLHRFVTRSLRTTLFDAGPAPWEPAQEWTEAFLDWSDPLNQTVARTFEPNAGWAWLQGDAAAEGHVVGGCIDVLEFLKGTPWWPGPELWSGAVLMLETSEEAPSPLQVARWLRNYAHQGIVGELAAVLFGRPMRYPPSAVTELYDRVLDVLADAGRSDLPVVANLDVGHTSPQMVVPLGSRVRVDPVRRSVVALEPAVA